MMDPKLLAHYRATPRPPVFIRGMPPTESPRRTWPLVAYAVLLGMALAGCTAALISHL